MSRFGHRRQKFDVDDQELVVCESSYKTLHISRVMPALIMWNLLMKRNHIKHGGQSTFEELVQQVERSIQLMVMVNNLEFKTTGQSWPEMVKIIGAYKRRIYYHIAQWKLPEEDQLKCNKDGASKGNPGESAYGFCIRNKLETSSMHKSKLVLLQI
uniref:Putative ovule protein n=1 Tax=Solanum chacoense TaxID=4108 RepID=A0A0V0I4K1_SOLCH